MFVCAVLHVYVLYSTIHDVRIKAKENQKLFLYIYIIIKFSNDGENDRLLQIGKFWSLEELFSNRSSKIRLSKTSQKAGIMQDLLNPCKRILP